MRVATIVGNRPQFVKAAAVTPLLRERHEELLIHTGQHHDAELSAVFFDELGLPAPDYSLALGGGSNAAQLARMLAALDPLLGQLEPDLVLVYGDTNSTLAGALAAADRGLALAHVEAGMRSFDRSQPEERNRILTDALSALLLCSTVGAAEQLAAEQVPGRAVVVGDVMADVAATRRAAALADDGALAHYGLSAGASVLVTAHRAASVDDPARLEALIAVLEAVDGDVILPLHPRTRARLEAAGLLARATAASKLVAPLGYVEFAALLHHARAVLTDSGGVQKEAYLAAVPCITLRPVTEWTETVEAGWNVLTDLDAAAVVAALTHPRPAEHPALYGDGHAAARIVAELEALAAG
jgi:UDP-N-acetylglucosamine 2-epimerase (non-hydrolysing)/UDP-GlcNAc3NAcA epimerase